jgi:DNA primase
MEIAARTGLIKERKSENGYYDNFRSRIIFPIQNVKGKIIAFGGRLINDDDAESPKYLNSPESPIYEKGANLYGLNLAYEQIRKQKNAILVEGYMDLITAHQSDVRNVVATLGTALTKRQVKLLKRYAPQVTMVFDADDAGRTAAERGHGIFLEEGLRVNAASLPTGSDPDAFIKQQGAEAFTAEINKSKPLMEFIIDNAVAEHDLSTIQGKVDCVNSVLPFLARIENSVERGEYVKLLSEKASVPEKDIQTDLGRSSTRARSRPHGPQKEALKAEPEKDRYSAAEEQLLHLLLHQREILNMHPGRLKPELFKRDENNRIIKALLKLNDQEQSESLAGLIDILESDGARQLASQLMMQQVDLDDWQRTTKDCLKLLEERAAEPGVSTVEILNKTALELKEAESRGEDIGPLLRKLQELRSRLKSEGSERELIRIERR